MFVVGHVDLEVLVQSPTVVFPGWNSVECKVGSNVEEFSPGKGNSEIMEFHVFLDNSKVISPGVVDMSFSPGTKFLETLFDAECLGQIFLGDVGKTGKVLR